MLIMPLIVINVLLLGMSLIVLHLQGGLNRNNIVGAITAAIIAGCTAYFVLKYWPGDLTDCSTNATIIERPTENSFIKITPR